MNFTKKELTTILQSLSNELKITREADNQDKETIEWGNSVEALIEKVEKELKN